MRLVIAFLLLVACEGSAPKEIDADPRGPQCTAKVYDLCLEEHDCMGDAGAGLCQTFPAQGFQVCTVACGTGCPLDKSGQAGVCDSGACRPSAPNMCHL